MLQTTWAASWFKVKTQLEGMTDHFIGYDKYQQICVAEGVTEKAAQDTLVDFLNDLGVILHFKDLELLDTHVLEPRWVTEAVYKIINSEKLALNKGILRLNWLDEILAQPDETDYFYPRDKHRYIIELMKKFELCFAIDSRRALIPDLLEVQESAFPFDYAASLKFLIEYDFLPRSVMPRFIVRLHKDIKGELRWRTGVVLEDKAFHSTTVVKSDDEARKIHIWVNGELKRDYFSVIRHAFRDINGSFEKLEAKEMVPCNCSECVDKLAPHYYKYEHLIRRQQRGRATIDCEESIEDVSIEDLLSGINPTLPPARDGWDVFISYSTKDIDIIKEIIFDLNSRGITYWLDDE